MVYLSLLAADGGCRRIFIVIVVLLVVLGVEFNLNPPKRGVEFNLNPPKRGVENRGVDFYCRFLPAKLRSRFLLPLSSRQNKLTVLPAISEHAKVVAVVTSYLWMWIFRIPRVRFRVECGCEDDPTDTDQTINYHNF